MFFFKKISGRAALLLGASAILVLFGFGACVFFAGEKKCGDVPGILRERKSFDAAFPLKLGNATIFVRLALTEMERQQGLTGCRGLAENSGMLFVYPDADSRGFWMRGVPINLSIGFFDSSGKLLEKKKMRANDFSVTSSKSDQVKFVLEMPEGWFERNAICAGTSFSPEALAPFVAERGFSPEKFEISSEN